MTHIINIRKGATIVKSASGMQFTLRKSDWTRRAFRDPNSGCMCFYFHDALCYVMEDSDYTIISEL